MVKSTKKGPSPVLKFAALALIALGAMYGTEYVTKSFQIMPVKVPPTPAEGAKIIDVSRFYPVMVRFVPRGESQASEEDKNIDELFKGKLQEDKKKDIAPPIDYVGIVRSKVALSAVTNDGAIINDEFVRVNQIIQSATEPVGTRFLKPYLKSVGPDYVVIGIDRQSLKIALAK